MLGKQWLNRYLRHAGGSTIERCGDRQRKLEGLERWPLHTFVESLPVMLQIALVLLACGLCRHMTSVNARVSGVLMTLTVLGILFYFGIVIAGTSSYECPFQTPASTNLRGLWEKVGPRITVVVPPIIDALHSLWEITLCRILRIMLRLPFKLDAWRCFRGSHPPDAGEDAPTPLLAALPKLWENIRSKILRAALRFPLAPKLNLRNRFCRPPLPTTRDPPVPQEMDPWSTPKDLAAFLMNNTSDVRCVSWILRNITDPEALDAAVRLAGTVRWFEEGIDVEPPYDAIVSVFESCFDSTKKVYPGMRDRAYYSIRAILWIHALAKCKSRELAQMFPLPVIGEVETPTDDLTHLLSVCFHSMDPDYNHRLFSVVYTIPHEANHAHVQWASNLLLHLAWTERGDPRIFHWFCEYETTYRYNDLDTIPLDATLNRFLVWCIFLGSPVEEEVLRIQDKSYVISCFFFQATHATVY